MEKMRMESVDMTAQNIEKIGALFPNCITETVDENGKPKKAINFDLLKQMLSGDVIEGSEAYEFTWVGKKAAIVEANRPIRKTLRPCMGKASCMQRREDYGSEHQGEHHSCGRHKGTLDNCENCGCFGNSSIDCAEVLCLATAHCACCGWMFCRNNGTLGNTDVWI